MKTVVLQFETSQDAGDFFQEIIEAIRIRQDTKLTNNESDTSILEMSDELALTASHATTAQLV